MAKKTRKLEEVTNDVTVNNNEVLATEIKDTVQEHIVVDLEEQKDKEVDEPTVISSEKTLEEEKSKEDIVNETVKEEKVEQAKVTKEKCDSTKPQTEEHKKKVAQRFFGNYIWNGLISDIVIPKQN